MAGKKLPMRKIREILRLKYEVGLSHRAIGRAEATLCLPYFLSLFEESVPGRSGQPTLVSNEARLSVRGWVLTGDVGAISTK